MSTRRIISNIAPALFFVAITSMTVSSAMAQNMMQQNNASGMATWNWVQSLVSFAIGILIGFFFGYLSARRKK